ncbi:nucleoporin NUP100/NSP100, putative [Plasmodium sp. gorilla clade G3]|nr:nucleoporin NUP100/NSP100, putative [Plasmodium sp. gorilla clade G3]
MFNQNFNNSNLNKGNFQDSNNLLKNKNMFMQNTSQNNNIFGTFNQNNNTNKSLFGNSNLQSNIGNTDNSLFGGSKIQQPNNALVNKSIFNLGGSSSTSTGLGGGKSIYENMNSQSNLSTKNIFGSTNVSNNTQGNMGGNSLFMNANNQNNLNMKNIFGSSSGLNNQTSNLGNKSIFGGLQPSNQTTSSNNIFGNMSSNQTNSSNIFGNLSSTSQNKSNSIFGGLGTSTNQSSGGGLFGNTGTTSQNKTGGIFGGLSSANQASTSNNSMFGGLSSNQTKPTNSLFGGLSSGATSNTGTQQSGNLFGNASGMGQSKAVGGIFGNLPSANQAATTSSNMFGGLSSNQAKTTSSLFGGLSSGTTTNTSAQQSGNLFGSATGLGQNKTVGGIFGTLPSANQTSASSSNMFGGLSTNQAKPTSSLFGGMSSGTTGITTNTTAQSGNLFGGTGTSQNKTGNLFGALPGANQTSTTSNIFGGLSSTQSKPTSNLFGTMGTASATTTPQSTSSNIFGSTSGLNQSKPSPGNVFGSLQTMTQPGSTSMFGTPQPTSQGLTSNNMFSASTVAGSSQNKFTNMFGTLSGTTGSTPMGTLTTPSGTTTGTTGLTGTGVGGTSGTSNIFGNVSGGSSFGNLSANKNIFGSTGTGMTLSTASTSLSPSAGTSLGQNLGGSMTSTLNTNLTTPGFGQSGGSNIFGNLGGTVTSNIGSTTTPTPSSNTLLGSTLTSGLSSTTDNASKNFLLGDKNALTISPLGGTSTLPTSSTNLSMQTGTGLTSSTPNILINDQPRVVDNLKLVNELKRDKESNVRSTDNFRGLHDELTIIKKKESIFDKIYNDDMDYEDEEEEDEEGGSSGGLFYNYINLIINDNINNIQKSTLTLLNDHDSLMWDNFKSHIFKNFVDYLVNFKQKKNQKIIKGNVLDLDQHEFQILIWLYNVNSTNLNFIPFKSFYYLLLSETNLNYSKVLIGGSDKKILLDNFIEVNDHYYINSNNDIFKSQLNKYRNSSLHRDEYNSSLDIDSMYKQLLKDILNSLLNMNLSITKENMRKKMKGENLKKGNEGKSEEVDIKKKKRVNEEKKKKRTKGKKKNQRVAKYKNEINEDSNEEEKSYESDDNDKNVDDNGENIDDNDQSDYDNDQSYDDNDQSYDDNDQSYDDNDQSYDDNDKSYDDNDENNINTRKMVKIPQFRYENILLNYLFGTLQHLHDKFYKIEISNYVSKDLNQIDEYFLDAKSNAIFSYCYNNFYKNEMDKENSTIHFFFYLVNIMFRCGNYIGLIQIIKLEEFIKNLNIDNYLYDFVILLIRILLLIYNKKNTMDIFENMKVDIDCTDIFKKKIHMSNIINFFHSIIYLCINNIYAYDLLCILFSDIFCKKGNMYTNRDKKIAMKNIFFYIRKKNVTISNTTNSSNNNNHGASVFHGVFDDDILADKNYIKEIRNRHMNYDYNNDKIMMNGSLHKNRHHPNNSNKDGNIYYNDTINDSSNDDYGEDEDVDGYNSRDNDKKNKKKPFLFDMISNMLQKPKTVKEYENDFHNGMDINDEVNKGIYNLRKSTFSKNPNDIYLGVTNRHAFNFQYCNIETSIWIELCLFLSKNFNIYGSKFIDNFDIIDTDALYCEEENVSHINDTKCRRERINKRIEVLFITISNYIINENKEYLYICSKLKVDEVMNNFLINDGKISEKLKGNINKVLKNNFLLYIKLFYYLLLVGNIYTTIVFLSCVSNNVQRILLVLSIFLHNNNIFENHLLNNIKMKTLQYLKFRNDHNSILDTSHNITDVQNSENKFNLILLSMSNDDLPFDHFVLRNNNINILLKITYLLNLKTNISIKLLKSIVQENQDVLLHESVIGHINNDGNIFYGKLQDFLFLFKNKIKIRKDIKCFFLMYYILYKQNVSNNILLKTRQNEIDDEYLYKSRNFKFIHNKNINTLNKISLDNSLISVHSSILYKISQFYAILAYFANQRKNYIISFICYYILKDEDSAINSLIRIYNDELIYYFHNNEKEYNYIRKCAFRFFHLAKNMWPSNVKLESIENKSYLILCILFMKKKLFEEAFVIFSTNLVPDNMLEKLSTADYYNIDLSSNFLMTLKELCTQNYRIDELVSKPALKAIIKFLNPIKDKLDPQIVESINYLDEINY